MTQGAFIYDPGQKTFRPRGLQDRKAAAPVAETSSSPAVRADATPPQEARPVRIRKSARGKRLTWIGTLLLVGIWAALLLIWRAQVKGRFEDARELEPLKQRPTDVYRIRVER
jgi:hypothetical protein